MTGEHVNVADKCRVAVVVGASGGIGGALVAALQANASYDVVLALSRHGVAEDQTPNAKNDGHLRQAVHGHVDLTDEASVAAAAAQAQGLGEVRLVLVASGVLHSPGLGPEKTWAAIDPQHMLDVYAVNAVGPALVAKHLLPLLPRQGRSVFAALSARVGSIGDNRVGGWYTYRASKAALNMVIKTLSVELARRAPQAVCVGLHPGTVDTGLSRNFQASVAPGKLFTPDQAAAHLLAVIDALTTEMSGCVLAWDGAVVPP